MARKMAGKMADLQFLKWAWLLNFANDINVRLGIIIEPPRLIFVNINFSATAAKLKQLTIPKKLRENQ